jgi:hypothetical protein
MNQSELSARIESFLQQHVANHNKLLTMVNGLQERGEFTPELATLWETYQRAHLAAADLIAAKRPVPEVINSLVTAMEHARKIADIWPPEPSAN